MPALSHAAAIAEALKTTAERSAGRPVATADTTSLEEVLSREPALAEFVREDMRGSGMGAGRLTTSLLASWAVNRTLSVGVDQTVADLDRYARSSTFLCRFVVGIRGVAVSGDTEVGAGVALSRPSPDIELFERPQRRSSAALTIVADYPKLLTANSDLRAMVNMVNFNKGKAASDRIFERLDTARLCLALAINRRVLETIRTVSTFESTPGSAAGANTPAYVPAIENHELQQSEIDHAIDLHVRITALAGSLRDRLTIAMHRWTTSLEHGFSPDLFIDVGIGLEAIFLPEESAELKYRLVTRAARLLGGSTKETRTKMARLVEALYDARSHAVHSGRMLRKVKAVTGARDVEDLAIIGNRLLREAIIVMIHRGRDDWDELVYG